MANEIKSIAQLLIESAKQDLAACSVLADSALVGDAIIGFHAQQAAEKALKAVLSANGIEFRRTHDLITLMDLMEDHSLPAPPHAESLDELNPYAVEARYGTIEPGDLNRATALAMALAVVTWAESQMSHAKR